MVKVIKNKSDKQKLLNIYIPIIQDYSKNMILSYNELKKQLLLNFNMDVTIEDIRLYFEPTINEEVDDLLLMSKNLNLFYE